MRKMGGGGQRNSWGGKKSGLEDNMGGGGGGEGGGREINRERKIRLKNWGGKEAHAKSLDNLWSKRRGEREGLTLNRSFEEERQVKIKD